MPWMTTEFKDVGLTTGLANVAVYTVGETAGPILFGYSQSDGSKGDLVTDSIIQTSLDGTNWTTGDTIHGRANIGKGQIAHPINNPGKFIRVRAKFGSSSNFDFFYSEFSEV